MDTLADIKQAIMRTLTCPLKDAAKNIVFGKGNPNADIFFIGEAPGAKEDEKGEPFVGAAGKQLDKLLSSIDLTLADCYIANILKYRPPKNRNPNKDEISSHTPYLVQQIRAVNPKVIVPMGQFACSFVLAGFSVDAMKKVKIISKIHGKIFEVEVDGVSFVVIPLYHPAACLYRPSLRDTLLSDFQIIRGVIDG